LYGPISHPRVQKSLVVAEFNNIALDHTPEFEFGIDNKKPSYLEKFPLGQTPSFEASNGLLLTESSTIAYHLCQANIKTTLLGKTPDELSKIWQYVIYTETSFTAPAFKLFKQKFLNEPLTINEESSNTKEFYKCLEYLDGQLKDKKYLVGDCISFADINLVCNIYLIYQKMMDKEMRVKYSNLTNYYESLIKLDEFKKWIGEVEYEEN
jgi:elongation factor 1-gamma